jgi:hypothetical protein
VCVRVLFLEPGKVLHNTDLSKFENTFKLTISEQLHIRGAHKTMMMMMITIIIILLKLNKEEFSKIVNKKINCMVQ